MKLLYISSVNPKVKSGYYNAVKDRISAIRTIRDIHLTTLNYSRTLEKSFFEIAIKKPTLLFQKWPISTLENIYLERSLLAKINEVRPDIVHVHWAYPIGYCTIKACLSLNIPCVLTCHGSDIHTNPKKSRFIARKTKWALEKASKVIFVSESLRTKAYSVFGKSLKSISIPNALDKSLATFSNTKHKNKNAATISYVGNLNPTKGADLLPSIFDAIKAMYKNTCFTIAGDGPLRKEIEAAVKAQNIDVAFLGHIPREQSLELIMKSDIVLLPSRDEGFGIVALEAFSLKTPCIAFNIPGLHEVFKGNEQLLVEEGSIENFATKTIDVINGKVDVNFDRYITDYDISSTIAKEITQYKYLLHR